MRELCEAITRGELGGGIPIQPTPMDFGAVLRAVVDEIATAHHGAEIVIDTETSPSWRN